MEGGREEAGRGEEKEERAHNKVHTHVPSLQENSHAQARGPQYLVVGAGCPAVKLPGRRLRLGHFSDDAGHTCCFAPVLSFLLSALGISAVYRAQ